MQAQRHVAAHGRAGDFARLGIDPGGDVHAKLRRVMCVDVVDRAVEKALGRTGKARTEERVDDERRIAAEDLGLLERLVAVDKVHVHMHFHQAARVLFGRVGQDAVPRRQNDHAHAAPRLVQKTRGGKCVAAVVAAPAEQGDLTLRRGVRHDARDLDGGVFH